MAEPARTPVTPWRRVALNNGFERIVAVDGAGKTIHVAKMAVGSDVAIAEISFELQQAFDLASACLAGNSRALTTPALTRILCASLLVLGVAAFKAGGVTVLQGGPDERDFEPDDSDRGVEEGSGVND